MEKNNSAESNIILEKVMNLSENVDKLYSVIVKENYVKEEVFVELFSYLSQIIDLLQKEKRFESLTEEYKEKRNKFVQLRKVCELREIAEKKGPEQRNEDMFINIIQSCISSCENLKKNNATINEGTVMIDFDKLKNLYIELINCDEISDNLYTEITEKTKNLKEIYEGICEENEKI